MAFQLDRLPNQTKSNRIPHTVSSKNEEIEYWRTSNRISHIVSSKNEESKLKERQIAFHTVSYHQKMKKPNWRNEMKNETKSKRNVRKKNIIKKVLHKHKI